MAFTKAIELSREDREYLQSLTRTRTIQAQVVDRAKILLYKEQGESNQAIADRIDVNINTVKLCLKKYKDGGIQNALFDVQRSGRPVEIGEDSVSWIIDVACQRPTELGFAQELWTLSSLCKYINEHAVEAGYPRLETITKQMIQKILKSRDIKPFKLKYYCEKRDPDFDNKMHDILVVYKQVSMQFDDEGNLIIPENEAMIHTVSCDEKPGIQAIDVTGKDLRPTEKNGYVYRDAEYKRLGTLSLLAGIDLLTGEAFPVVSESHKSSDFIELLKKMDASYPEGDIIRIVCDNHSIHTSKETKNYLSTLPEGRFVFVFTPTHGSWLNLVESFFSKMTKQMLKGIRVKSKNELKDRIYQYFDEVNAEPVVFRWKYHMDSITDDEAMHAGINPTETRLNNQASY